MPSNNKYKSGIHASETELSNLGTHRGSEGSVDSRSQKTRSINLAMEDGVTSRREMGGLQRHLTYANPGSSAAMYNSQDLRSSDQRRNSASVFPMTRSPLASTSLTLRIEAHKEAAKNLSGMSKAPNDMAKDAASIWLSRSRSRMKSGLSSTCTKTIEERSESGSEQRSRNNSLPNIRCQDPLDSRSELMIPESLNNLSPHATFHPSRQISGLSEADRRNLASSHLTTKIGRALFATDNDENNKKIEAHHRLLNNCNHLGGKPQLKFKAIDDRGLRTFKDLFNEIMSYSTPMLLLLLFSGILTLWMVFAVLYYFINELIMWNFGSEIKKASCISFEANFTFVNAFLYSLESQTTIGYGGRHPEDRFFDCWAIILIQSIQPIIALASEGMLVVIVFTRLTDARYTRIRYFLKKCVICERDGELNLVIRSGIDMGSINDKVPDLVGLSFTGKLLKTRFTVEGYRINLEERDIYFSPCDLICTQLPVDMAHVINVDSPLYEFGKSICDNNSEQLEIIMTLTATIESTGAIYQTTQSYVTEDILWGKRFAQCIFREKHGFVFREENVDKIEDIDMNEKSQEMRDFDQAAEHQETQENYFIDQM